MRALADARYGAEPPMNGTMKNGNASVRARKNYDGLPCTYLVVLAPYMTTSGPVDRTAVDRIQPCSRSRRPALYLALRLALSLISTQ